MNNVTDITIGERCSGKTTRLIKRSAAEGLLIVTGNTMQAEFIFYQAKRMDLEIPKPMSIRQLLNLLNERGRGSFDKQIKGLLIDELDMMFDELFRGIPVEEVTITDRGNIKFSKPIYKWQFDFASWAKSFEREPIEPNKEFYYRFPKEV